MDSKPAFSAEPSFPAASSLAKRESASASREAFLVLQAEFKSSKTRRDSSLFSGGYCLQPGHQTIAATMARAAAEVARIVKRLLGAPSASEFTGNIPKVHA